MAAIVLSNRNHLIHTEIYYTYILSWETLKEYHLLPDYSHNALCTQYKLKSILFFNHRTKLAWVDILKGFHSNFTKIHFEWENFQRQFQFPISLLYSQLIFNFLQYFRLVIEWMRDRNKNKNHPANPSRIDAVLYALNYWSWT